MHIEDKKVQDMTVASWVRLQNSTGRKKTDGNGREM
jgi:hypothetical protein